MGIALFFFRKMKLLCKESQEVKRFHKTCEKLDCAEPDWDLVMQYLPLLKSIVREVVFKSAPDIDREGVYTVGLLGLIHAAHRYNRSIKYSFSTYATIRIRGAISDEFRRLDWLSRTKRAKVKRFKKKISELENTLGHHLSEEEIHQYAPEDTYVKQWLHPVMLTLDTNTCVAQTEGESHNLQEVLADLDQENGREMYEKKEMLKVLKRCLKELPKTLQRVLVLYYIESLNFSEIAQLFQLSESRICQMHAEALLKLRRRFQCCIQ